MVVSMVDVAFLKRPVRKEPGDSVRCGLFVGVCAAEFCAVLSPTSIKSANVSGSCGNELEASECVGLFVVDVTAEFAAGGGSDIRSDGSVGEDAMKTGVWFNARRQGTP